MTIIAWDGKTLAADKRSVNVGFGSTVTKIYRHESSLLALSGDESCAREMLAWFKAGADPKEFPSKAREDVSALIQIDASGVKVFASGPYPGPREQTFLAWGSGRDYALAAMHLGCDAVKAVEVACQFDNCCGNGIDTLTL